MKLLGGAIGVMVVLGVLQIWLWPVVAEAVRDYTVAQRENERVEILNQQLAQLQARLAEQNTALTTIVDIIPLADMLPFVVTKMERQAAELGLTLRLSEIFERELVVTAEVSPSPMPQGVRTVVTRVYVTGSAPALLTWLDQLEHMTELTAVPRWSLRILGEQTIGIGVPRYETELDIELYIRGAVGLEQVKGLLTTQ